MGGVIDTNILLYAANQQAEEHDAARAFFERAAGSGDVWFFTDGIFYEFLRVSTHHKVFPSPLSADQAMRFLQPFLTSPRFEILQAGARHWSVLSDILSGVVNPSGNLFFDLRTVALMREHGVRSIYTRDADFFRFRKLEVIDPLS